MLFCTIDKGMNAKTQIKRVIILHALTCSLSTPVDELMNSNLATPGLEDGSAAAASAPGFRGAPLATGDQRVCLPIPSLDTSQLQHGSTRYIENLSAFASN